MEGKSCQEEEQKEEKNYPFLTKAASNNIHPTRNTFRKKEHLKSYSLIRSLFASGHSIKSYPITLIWKDLDESETVVPASVGFSAPRKFFKNAVDRNKIKRKMREAYRLYRNEFFRELDKSTVAMMFIYSAPDNIGYEKIKSKLISCCKRLLIQLNENN